MYMYIQFIQCSPQLWLTENYNLYINSFIHSFFLNRIKKKFLYSFVVYILQQYREMIVAFQENQSVLYYFLLKLLLKTWKQLSYSFLAETCQFNGVNNLQTV